MKKNDKGIGKRKLCSILSKKGRAIWAFTYVPILLFYDVTRVMAKDTDVSTSTTTGTGVQEIDAVLSAIKTLFLGLVTAIGLIILIKGIADTAQAYQQQDSHGMYDGAKGIAAGAIMVFIGPLLTLLGVV